MALVAINVWSSLLMRDIISIKSLVAINAREAGATMDR